MRITKIAMTTLLAVVIAAPAMASNGWVDDFLRRYQPVTAATGDPGPVAAVRPAGQLFPTGTVPVALSTSST